MKKEKTFTGKSAGCPAYKAGRKADPLIISTFPGSPALWVGSFTYNLGHTPKPEVRDSMREADQPASCGPKCSALQISVVEVDGQ